MNAGLVTVPQAWRPAQISTPHTVYRVCFLLVRCCCWLCAVHVTANLRFALRKVSGPQPASSAQDALGASHLLCLWAQACSATGCVWLVCPCTTLRVGQCLGKALSGPQHTAPLHVPVPCVAGSRAPPAEIHFRPSGCLPFRLVRVLWRYTARGKLRHTYHTNSYMHTDVVHLSWMRHSCM